MSLGFSEPWGERHSGDEVAVQTRAWHLANWSSPLAPIPLPPPLVISHNKHTRFFNYFHQLMSCKKRDAIHFTSESHFCLGKSHFKTSWSSGWWGRGGTIFWQNLTKGFLWRPLSGIILVFISWCRWLCSLTAGLYSCERPRIAAATWEQSSPWGLIIVPDKQRGRSQHVMAVFNRDKWWADGTKWAASL